MTDEAVRRAAEVFNDALEQARADRVTMSELCAQLRTNPKTVKHHIGRGWLRGAVEAIGGKPVWFFEQGEVQRYAQVRAELESESVRSARLARGGNKLAQAPSGFVTLIDIAAQTGHSMDFMRAAARRFGFETARGPKRVIMLSEADAPRFVNVVAQIPPRPTRQKKASRQTGILWTEEMDAELGKDSDATLAGRWGVSVSAVNQRRAKLGIVAFRRLAGTVEWTPEMDAELGTAQDVTLAKKWDITPLRVFHRRKKLNIPAHKPRPDGSARGAGIMWTKEMDDALGTAHDADVALKFGVSPGATKQRRQKLGIAPHSPAAKSKNEARRSGIRRQIEWTEEMDAALGTKQDFLLAKPWGVASSTVAARRHTLGIAPFKKPPKEEAVATHASHERLTPEQFDALARLLRLRGGPAVEAARAALVDGAARHESLAAIARAHAVTPSQLGNVLRRIRSGLALARAACDTD